MRKVVAHTRDHAEAVVPTLVDAIVARPTDHDTIIQIVPTAKLCMLDVVGLCGLSKRVLGSSAVTNPRDRRPA